MHHPLAPLDEAELAAAIRALRDAGCLGDRHLLVHLGLDEPAKDDAHWTVGARGPRAGFAVVRERGTNAVTEHRIDLATGGVASRPVPGAQSAFTATEAAIGVPAVKAHPEVLRGLAARGIDDPALVHVELWPFGGQVPDDLRGRRLAWAALWVRRDERDNQYAHPIRGLEVIWDGGAEEVVRVIEHGPVPIPDADGRWLPEDVGPLRPRPAPLEVVQRDGPGFTVDADWAMTWEAWTLRVGFDQREGLVLRTLAFDGRPVCYRASIAELAIPYADTSATSYRKAAFDTGEIGLGQCTNSLRLGCDCLGEITYLDIHRATDTGEVVTIPNGICIHEEDAGILWKHVDDLTGRAVVRRARRLVISSIVTVDNYEYGFYWYLYQDGAIEFEAKLTGIVLTAALAPGETTPWGAEVAPRVNAMYHQHFFCARLDLDIDGTANAAYAVAAAFAGDAFTQEARLLATEDEDAGLIDPLANRQWVVVNRERRNGVGRPTGYRLVPGGNVRLFLDRESRMGRRMAFASRHVWVTPHDPAERWPAGDYPNLSEEAGGLPDWTREAASIVDQDLVLWYAFGTHHVPRTEDWPVMPVVRIGFRLEPLGFFDRNPSIDLPA